MIVPFVDELDPYQSITSKFEPLPNFLDMKEVPLPAQTASRWARLKLQTKVRFCLMR